ncbi:unnamed protein product (macronuclear) [Paramecium tetraurelia]|uniref:Protein kinase domain-containing protein n=1 Tax=Paramecium tetraurelia TaxID=5888 RepID=A0E054_PARTE|nr:uncharacterized protein GSPATT00021839001 [Paramecium tetraurelia]CAK88671.1 unnamed protein product [Paramecium tetraurelia]|eukprot:XP_001456068.1 hypothetical protein (macronuclear) [Paramecium tetraurelia strain d4-2]
MSEDWKKKKIDNFVILNKILGKGTYGTVYLGYMDTGQNQVRIAVKTVPMDSVKQSPQILNLIKRESTILKAVEHPNIVRLYNANRTQNYIYIFLEFCPDGDLRKFMLSKKEKHLSELEAIIFLKHIVEGFKELFQKKIIHRDIKPENILLSNGIAKIADFGFARVMEVEMDEPGKFSRNGTPIYMSPQILRGQPFSAKCDVWSLGIMFYEMLYGRTPWQAESQIQLEQLILNKPLKFPTKPVRSQKVKELVAMMLQIEEKDRLNWQQIFENQVIKMNEDMVRQNMNEIMKEDPMTKSMSLNKIYLDQYKVVGYLHTKIEDYREDSKNDLDGLKQMFDEENPDLILSQYQKEMKRRESFQKFYTYYLYERNVAFFINYTQLRIIKLQTFGDITLVKEQFLQLIFMLARNQLLHLDKINSALNSNKHDQFDQELWGRFIVSKDCSRLLTTIKNDILIIKEVFIQVREKCPQFQQFFDKIENVKDFLGQYKQIISKAIETLKAASTNSLGKDIYSGIYYLKICLNPYDFFKQVDFDFNAFYEETENANLDELLNLI